MSKPQKLRRAVIKEELVALTDDPVLALMLNQFIYWTERAKDIDAYIKEEQGRQQAAGQDPMALLPATHGWIYKKASELNEELMLKASEQTIRRHLDRLCNLGLLESRRNPLYAWDKTLQYRVNLSSLQERLSSLGYPLEGYALLDGASILHNGGSNLQNGASYLQNGGAISKITSEITSEAYKEEQAPLLPELSAKEIEGKEKAALYAAYFEILKELDPGSTYGNKGEIGSAINKLHKAGCSPWELKECYRTYKAEPFYQGKHLSLTTIANQLGAWRRQHPSEDDSKAMEMGKQAALPPPPAWDDNHPLWQAALRSQAAREAAGIAPLSQEELEANDSFDTGYRGA